MSRTVAIGIQDFEVIRNGNYFYVDKTEFIREWWNNGDSVTLITRPRRFGKTLTLGMIEKFFSVKYAGRNDLFEGLKIWEYPEFRELQGTFPVIKISFAGIKEKTFEGTIRKIYRLLIWMYKSYSFLWSNESSMNIDLDYVNDINMGMSVSDASLTLRYLSECLFGYYGKKPIILLDEYDSPMQSAWVNGFWDELSDFMKDLFEETFKSNEFLGRGLLTGITRVSKENIFSGLNHLRVCTVISSDYATSFGFTEEEVKAALKDYDLLEQFPEVMRWYDGFKFGEVEHIYNPWSVLNFLRSRKLNPYWSNSSSNNLINKLVQEGGREIKTSFEALLLGNSISSTINEEIVFGQLDEDLESVYSLLLASGYLSIDKTNTSSREYTLRITNYEVFEMFQIMVHKWFVKYTKEEYHTFIKALISGNISEVNRCLRTILLETISSFDVGRGSAPEKFYHGLILGMVVALQSKYLIRSNRESGTGRYDVMLTPKQHDLYAIVMEFKALKSDSQEILHKAVQTALAQINEKKYDTELSAQGIDQTNIVHYGFAFSRKQVLVGMEDSTGVTIPELPQEDPDSNEAKTSDAF